MYKEHHPIPYQTKMRERFLGPFSISEALWLFSGAVLSFQMTKIVPPLPLNTVIIKYIHYLIPIGVAAFMAYAIHPRTGFSMSKYLFIIFLMRFRRRKFTYRKVNMVEGGDRY